MPDFWAILYLESLHKRTVLAHSVGQCLLRVGFKFNLTTVETFLSLSPITSWWPAGVCQYNDHSQICFKNLNWQYGFLNDSDCHYRTKTIHLKKMGGPRWGHLRDEHWNSYNDCLNFGIFTDLKRIQTPNNFSVTLWGDSLYNLFQSCWSGGRVQVWVQVRAPACHLAITPKYSFRGQAKVSTAKSMAELLGQRSGTVFVGLTGKRKHTAFSSCWQSLQA